MGNDTIDCMQAKEALREAKQAAEDHKVLYEQVVSMISDIIWRYDVNVKGEPVDTYISPVADRMLGLPDGTIGNSFSKYSSYVHPDDLPAVQEILFEGIRTPETEKTAEYRLRKADGTTLWVRSRGSAYSHADGKVAVFGTTGDITERKRMEQALRQEKELAQLYLDIVGTIIISLRSDHTVSLVNQAGCRLLGYSEGEIIGANWFGRFLPAWAKKDVEEIFDQLMAGIIEPVMYVEGVVLTRNGEERIVSWHNTILKDEAGNITGTISSGEDITERKKAEEKIATSEALLSATLDSIPDIIGIQNPDHTIVRYNRAGYEFLNRPAEEVNGRRCFELIGQSIPCKECATEKALKTKRLEQIEKYLPEYRVYLDCRSNPVLNKDGEIEFIVEQLRDITERKRAEQDYRMLFQEMLDGFALHEIICDGQGKPTDYRFLAVNPTFERMTGLKGKDLVGRTVLEVMPGTEQHWIETYGKVALTGEPAFFENYSAELKKHFEVTAFRPAPNQFACIFSDITE
ncbi:MAG: PAS domain S-box protein, partial [Methanothrix sp.]|nr:PAS domain S-box protein [Methanothrix sp.]